jgi:hypothetical protein
MLRSCDSGVDALSQEQWLQEGVKHSNCLSLAKHGAGPKRGGMDMKPNPREKAGFVGYVTSRYCIQLMTSTQSGTLFGRFIV